MNRFVILLVVVLTVQNCVIGVKWTRCQIAKQLLDYGMPQDKLPDWVCLVESESGGNTAAKGGPNKNGSYDYGLFQINSRYWCGIGKIGGQCHIDCNSFLNDNISDDVKCAKKIYKIQGFNAWYGWQKKCKNQTLPDLDKCNL